MKILAKYWKVLLAVILATVNVAGGFALTHKMLSSFVKKGSKPEEEKNDG